MRPSHVSNDAPFSSLRARIVAEPLNFCQNLVAVHGVLDPIAWDEDIAVEVRHRRIRDDEAIAVVVKDQPTFYFIAIREARGLRAPHHILGQFLARRLPFRLAARESVPPTG